MFQWSVRLWVEWVLTLTSVSKNQSVFLWGLLSGDVCSVSQGPGNKTITLEDRSNVFLLGFNLQITLWQIVK